MIKWTEALRHSVRLVAFGLSLAFATGAAAQERLDGKWFRYGGGI